MKLTALSDVVVVALLMLSTGGVIDLITARLVPVEVPDFGVIYGLQHKLEDGAETDEFLGIPYANPPVGDLRFRPPQTFKPKKDWTFNATTLPNSCYQIPDVTFDKKYVDLWNPNTNMSEDCLYLNIWRPTAPASSGEKRAVLVWIYGGGFSTGSSTLEIYDSKYLASHGDVIVVSMQYRVGPLGFLALCKESGVAGNAGLLDQQAALEWVHKYIGSFGGDPARVTIFGESAGAVSVSYHLLSPGSKNLFQSAIMQSAAAGGGKWNFVEWDRAIEKATALAELVNCPTSRKHSEIASCLRKASAADLTNKQFDVKVDGPPITSAFPPTVDGLFIKENPVDIIDNMNFHEKNILIGTNHDEGSYFMLYTYPDIFNVTQDEARQIDQQTFKKLVSKLNLVDDHEDEDDDEENDDDNDDDDDDDENDDEFLDDVILFEYGTPCSDGDSNSFSYTSALQNLMGDFMFKCPVVSFANAYVKDNQSVYVFNFKHRTSGNPWPEWTGAAHGYELDHVFGMPSQSKHKAQYTDEERTLSNQIITYWTNFAKTGDPNKGVTGKVSLIPWPKYTQDSRSVLVLDKATLSVQKGLRDRQCHFWNELFPLLEEAADSGAKWYRSSILFTLLSISVAVVLRT